MGKLRALVRNKNLKNVYVISFILLPLAVLVLFLILFVNKDSDLGKEVIPIYIQIDKVAGLKVQNETLDFGSIPSGSSGGKKIKIKNNYNFPVKIEFEVSGEVKDFMIFDTPVYLKEGEVREISVSTIIFTNEPIGNYSGNFTAVFKRDIREQ